MRTKEQKITYHLKKLSSIILINNITDIQFDQIITGTLPESISRTIYYSLRKHYKLLTDYSKMT